MSKNTNHRTESELVVPGEKIAVIEEFLPDETCFEEDGEIFSQVLGYVVTDRKKHKISIKPIEQHFKLSKGDFAFGRVEFVKKQIASLSLYYLNDKSISLPISAILHVSEASRHFVKNMYEVARPGDWLKVKIIRCTSPVYVSLVGNDLGVMIAYCNRCGQELELKRRNLLSCPNCGLIQPRITSRYYGKPLIHKSGLFQNEVRR
ncbi:MAG: exosome complex RNA-binding protein Csl4 [Candidatus Hodarchaeales archaeon]